ncbi:hypothetical protein NL676_001859 [Syzygium grande]|nr:hypothetical protein NL676_001859 [Syzygium grande]
MDPVREHGKLHFLDFVWTIGVGVVLAWADLPGHEETPACRVKEPRKGEEQNIRPMTRGGTAEGLGSSRGGPAHVASAGGAPARAPLSQLAR